MTKEDGIKKAEALLKLHNQVFKKLTLKNVIGNIRCRGGFSLIVNLNLGDVSFHHGLTFHRAKPNNSKEDRIVHTVIFFEDGSKRSDDKFHFSVDRPGIKVGQVIRSEVTPLAYPIKSVPSAPKEKISDDFMGYKMLGLLPKD